MVAGIHQTWAAVGHLVNSNSARCAGVKSGVRVCQIISELDLRENTVMSSLKGIRDS